MDQQTKTNHDWLAKCLKFVDFHVEWISSLSLLNVKFVYPKKINPLPVLPDIFWFARDFRTRITSTYELKNKKLWLSELDLEIFNFLC